MKTFVIIPAGGKGKRSGSATPKQFIKFNGKELIVYTLEVFQKNNLINDIVVAADPAYFKLLLKLRKKYKLTKLKSLVEGGRERQDSVFNALKSVQAKKNDLVIVHDAARPLLPDEVLTNAVKIAKLKGNAVVCVKAGDTLIKGNKKVKEYIDRKNIYYVQTPQIFNYSILMRAMKKAYLENFYGTDESMLVKRAGRQMNIVDGSLMNFKITTKADIELLRKLI